MNRIVGAILGSGGASGESAATGAFSHAADAPALVRDGTLGVVADALLVFFAIFTATGHVAYFAGMSFAHWWMLGGPLGTVAACAWMWHASSERAQSGPQSGAADSLRNAPLLIAIVVAVGFTVCLHRPDADDECYLGLAMISLDNPAARLDSQFAALSCLRGYSLTSFDFLRGSTTWLSGLPLLASYYLLWPAIVAAAVVVFQFRLYKQFGVRHLTLALLVFFIVMLAWGDTHRSPANFGFVRFFQGKGALFWLTIPAATLFWLRAVTTGGRRPIFLLACVIVAGTGFTPTGVSVGILLLGIFWLATLLHHGLRGPRRWLLGWLPVIAAYPFAIGLTIWYQMSTQPFVTRLGPGANLGPPNLKMLDLVLGDGVRSIVALACAVMLPFLLRASPARRPIAIVSVLLSCLLLLPWTSALLAGISHDSFGWRWLYLIPFVPAMVVAVDRLAGAARPAPPRQALVASVLLLFVFASPHWVLSKWNYTRIGLPGYKLADAERVQLRTYEASAVIEGGRIVSPVTGKRL